MEFVMIDATPSFLDISSPVLSQIGSKDLMEISILDQTPRVLNILSPALSELGPMENCTPMMSTSQSIYMCTPSQVPSILPDNKSSTCSGDIIEETTLNTPSLGEGKSDDSLNESCSPSNVLHPH